MHQQFSNYLTLLFIIILAACSPKISKQPSPLPKESAVKNTIFHLKAYVIKETVNVRQKPNTRSKIIATLQDGDPVQIIENHNGWYHIYLENGLKGWARSDLIGPRNLSKTIMAAAFNDSIMPNFSAQLFIDKNKPYQVIYLQFEDENNPKMDTYVKRIVKAYQEKVYHGPVTVHIIKQNSDQFIKSYTFKGMGIGDIPLPVLPAGVLQKFDLKGKAVKLQILVPEQTSKTKLLSMARKASAKYGYPFEKAEIVIRSMASKKCRLYYVEDAYGENYFFDRCEPPAS